MKKTLRICYRAGSAPVASECAVFGLGMEWAGEGEWKIHAEIETEVDDVFASELLHWTGQYSIECRDAGFAVPVPASADMMAGIVATAMGGDRLARRAYVMRTRFWRTDEWSEVTRRTVCRPASKGADGHGDGC